MGRKALKIKGALVRMGRRRRPGLGIIIEVSEVPPSQMSYEERFTQAHKPIAEDYQAASSSELVALVHWFERPSEWENKQTWSSKTWVPISWLRIVRGEK